MSEEQARLLDDLPGDPRDLEPEQEGFTGRTSLVILYGAFILMPANIYLLLVAGQSLITPIHFIALILWVEMCKFSRKPLTTAEAFIVYSVSGVAAGQLLFYLYAIHPAYFRRSPIATTAFKTVEMTVLKEIPIQAWIPFYGLASDATSIFQKQFLLPQSLAMSILSSAELKSFSDIAPTWWAPPREVVEQIPHSFFHRAWLTPVMIGVAVWICHVMANISLGIVCRELFVKQERLPFPFAHPTADACIALTQERPEFKRYFTITGLIGTIWGLVIYWPVAAGRKIVNYPIPWADFNSKIHTMPGLRGASVGIATDILAFTGGFIVPFRVICSMLAGGVAIQVVGNILTVKYGIFQRFETGMSIRTTLLNQVPVWMSVFIGGMVAAGILQLLGRPRQLLNAFRGLGATGKAAKEVGGLSMIVLLILFFGSVVGAVGIFKLLIPTFPVLYIAPFALIWSFVFSLIDARAIGTTGFRVQPPYVRQGLIILADKAKGGGVSPHVWFAPWPIALGASAWTQNFKICELVRCKPSSLIKASIIAIPVGMLANFVFMEIFWRIADIPSATYPYADTILPIYAQTMCIWMSTTTPVMNPDPTFSAANIFRIKWMLIAFGVFTAIYIANRIYGALRPKKEFVSLIGLAVGMAIPLPFSVSLFIGGILAIIVKKRWGAEWFNRYRNVLVAGLVVGEGVVIGICAAIAALKNSLVTIPY